MGARAKTIEDWKRLETPLKILRYRGSGMYERCGSWRDLICHRKVSKERISESEIVPLAGGSQRGS
ncbi:hypothetical protein [Anaerocolumna jejuensis]|uniref:hypothetical protein n=1 Tax=Anaerocolumna jejuensis TaxID=259063 RepID=UPI003F7BAAD9